MIFNYSIVALFAIASIYNSTRNVKLALIQLLSALLNLVFMMKEVK